MGVNHECQEGALSRQPVSRDPTRSNFGPVHVGPVASEHGRAAEVQGGFQAAADTSALIRVGCCREHAKRRQSIKDRYESRRSATKLISPRRSAAPNDVARPIYDEVPQAIFICKKAVFFQRKELHWSPPSSLKRRLSRERAHDKHSEKTWRRCSGCSRMRTNARSVGGVERRQSSPGRAPGGNLLLQVFWGSSWCAVP